MLVASPASEAPEAYALMSISHHSIARSGVKFARILLNLAAIGAGLVTFCGLFGNIWWVFELLDHPRGQYCLILLGAIAVNTISQTRWVWVLLVPLALNLALILPLFLPSATPPQSAETLRVLHLNLDRHNTNFTGVARYIEQTDADIVFLQEVTPTWLTEIESQVSRYEVRLSRAQNDTQGVALLVPVEPFADIEIVNTQIIHLPERSTRPLIETQIRWENTDTVLLSLHVIRSRNAGTSDYQKIEFASVARWSQEQAAQNRQAIVIGDFNSTPWSDRLRQLLGTSGLTNSLAGWGLHTTWPAYLPPPLRIPIDLCLHSPSLATLSRKIGPPLGSDHLPLWVEFGMENGE
ncbi:MAG: endonuclease/exonuclease/phosphatase family protein [Cyanobacteriota bacterium]|nr:endonuclease/exonuclease/phosphatase family protein [Cyanobacteriota bacterium]